MTSPEIGSLLTVTANGRQVDLDDFDSAVVDLDHQKAGAFTLRFWDVGEAPPPLRLGTKVVITFLAREGGAAAGPLLEGEVTAMEHEYSANGSFLVVQGYDLSHRLMRVRRTRAFTNVTDSDVLRQVAGEAKIPVGTIAPTSGVHVRLDQVACTDWAFLQTRARAQGLVLRLTDGRLSLTSIPAAKAASSLTLVAGEQLAQFRPRVSAAAQTSDVSVRSWDPAIKKPVLGRSRSARRSVLLTGVEPVGTARMFLAGTLELQEPGLSQAEADSRATAIASTLASTLVEAEGRAAGDPALVPGACVEITAPALRGGPSPYAGAYVLTRARHVFDADGYWTDVEVSGTQDRSLLGLTGGDRSPDALSGGNRTVAGVVVGLVTNIKDPLKQGRVRMTFPWLSDTYESDWARVAVLGGGPLRGSTFLPEVDDEVLVAFEMGDVRKPYVVGGLWNGKDAPPQRAQLVDPSRGALNRRAIVSRLGHALTMDDSAQAPGVTLTSGKGTLTISLDDKQTAVTVHSDGTVEIEGTQAVKVSGGTVELTAKQSMKLKAAGPLELEGAMVKITGNGPVQVKGTPIQLN